MAAQSLPLVPRCGHCQNTTSLLRCSRCKIQHYCSREHQAVDFNSHKSACKDILRSLEILKLEDEKVRNPSGDLVMPSNPFLNAVGHFWSFLPTRNYIKTRIAHVEQLGRVKTCDSAIAQLGHVMACLNLCSSAQLDLTDMAPHLMLRLDMDQQAYNFAKWWQETEGEVLADWDGKVVGYVKGKDGDCFEGLDYLQPRRIQLSNIVAVILLKIKMLLDLISLQELVVCKEVPVHVPAEIFNKIRNYIVRSPVIKKNTKIMKSRDQKDQISKLAQQVKKLYKFVDKANDCWWLIFLHPEMALDPKLSDSFPGNASRWQNIILSIHQAWMETPGAIEVIRELTKTKVAGKHF